MYMCIYIYIHMCIYTCNLSIIIMCSWIIVDVNTAFLNVSTKHGYGPFMIPVYQGDVKPTQGYWANRFEYNIYIYTYL